MIRALIILFAFAGAAQAAEPKSDAPAPIRIALSGVDLRAALDRAETTPSALERPIEPKTAVDWRVSDSGAKAQAGYLCGIGGIGPDSEPIPGGPASVYGHAGTFLGAALAVPLP
ncbi:MAG TPA: hypothetical protein VGG68_04175 [Caulobacteraceae bacterium]|jgi:hypothetical protein